MKATERILIDGATGYVGSHLVAKLSSCGYAVRCMVRPGANPLDIDFLKSCGAEIVFADLATPESVPSSAFEDVNTAVHLIGSIAPRRGESLERLHLGQTGPLVELCARHKVSKVMMITAAGTTPAAKSRYHATKWQAEECLRQSALDHLIIRPSLIVGRQVGRRDSKLVRRYCDLIANRPVVPLIGGGLNRVQPIFIGDLVAAMEATMRSDQWTGRTIELGGPEIVTMRDLVIELMKGLNVMRPLINLPPALATAVASLLEAAQPVPLLSRDQVTLSTLDSVCQDNALPSLLRERPTPLVEAIGSYKAGTCLDAART